MRCLARLCLSFVLLIAWANCNPAQDTKCALTAAQSPELRGLRLGMTAEQVRARLTIIETEAADEYGVSRLRIDPGSGQAETESVKDIAIELIGDRVVAIRLVYNPSATWKNHRELTEGLSASLMLPRAWKAVSFGSMVTGMEMECAGFKVSATLIGAKIPVLYLSAREAEPTLDKRREEKERRLREFFNPLH